MVDSHRFYSLCTATIAIFIVACDSSSPVLAPEAKTTIPPMVTSSKPSFIQPAVFARFPDYLPKNEKLVLYYDVAGKNDAGLCNKSSLYRANDICAPQTKTYAEVEKKPYPHSWGFTKTPEVFFWQQEISSGKELSVEILDNMGLPLPSNTTIEKSNNLFTVIVKPLAPLPQNKKISLVATQYGPNRKREQNWVQFIQIGSNAPSTLKQTSRVSQKTRTIGKKKATHKKRRANPHRKKRNKKER